MSDQSNIDIYNFIEQALEVEREQPTVSEVASEKLKIWIKSNIHNLVIIAGYGFTIYRMLLALTSCYWCIYYLDQRYLLNYNGLLIFNLFIPFATWLYSTCFDNWGYRNRKAPGLVIVVLSSVTVIASIVAHLSIIIIVPLILKLPIGPNITVELIVATARLTSAIISAGVFFLVSYMMLSHMLSKEFINVMLYYRFNRGFDTRNNKKFCYDMNIVRYLATGKMHRVYEHDRFLHSSFIGTTGTGKTSTCMTVQINDDLDQRVYNEDYLKKKTSKWLKNKKIYMTRDFDDTSFNITYFDSNNKRYKKKLDKLYKKVMPCGITAMAPNEKFSDELYNLTVSKGIKVNRVDPNLMNGHLKPGFIGYNPLYISPSLEGIDRKLDIFMKARIFADVNQAIFEKDEAGDIYFTGLNRNLTTSITIMILLTYPSLNNGKQPHPGIVQDVINNFSKAAPYRDQLIKLYSTKFNNNNKTNPVMDVGKANIGEYQFILDVIDKDVLGPGAKQMEDQARGLRNIINETLSNPLIRNVLCSERTIDLDQTLDKGEITYVNFAINLGSAGTAFGMFYLLSYINAVLRRPAGRALLPHFCFIDELPELLHPDLGRTYALFRQYRVSMNGAFQSLDQFDKSPKTRYLKNVVVGGCAHQMVFGRCSTAEMELYQTFAGTTEQVVEQRGVTETSLSMENTSKSMSKKETLQRVNNIEGGDMRYRDFREVTMFTVVNGSPIKPFFGKTFFLEDIKKVNKRRFRFNWSGYFTPIKEFDEEVDTIKNNSTMAAKSTITSHDRIIDSQEAERVETKQQSITAIESESKYIESDDEVSMFTSGKDIMHPFDENTNDENAISEEISQETNNSEEYFELLEEVMGDG